MQSTTNQSLADIDNLRFYRQKTGSPDLRGCGIAAWMYTRSGRPVVNCDWSTDMQVFPKTLHLRGVISERRARIDGHLVHSKQSFSFTDAALTSSWLSIPSPRLSNMLIFNYLEWCMVPEPSDSAATQSRNGSPRICIGKRESKARTRAQYIPKILRGRQKRREKDSDDRWEAISFKSHQLIVKQYSKVLLLSKPHPPMPSHTSPRPRSSRVRLSHPSPISTSHLGGTLVVRPII